MRLSVRRAAIAGLVLSIVLSAGAAARSTDQLQAFAMTLAATVTASLIVLAVVVAIDRRGRRQSER
jgi:flagellar biosynthesis protein FliR